MRSPDPLPRAALVGHHRSSDADAFGLSRGRIRRRDVTRPHHGVWTAERPAETLGERCRAYAPLLLQGQAFSHVTALGLGGAPVRTDVALHLSVAFPRTPPRGDGIRGHSLQRLEITVADGMPLTVPASAWVESAAITSREELVVLGDFLIAHGTAIEELLDALSRRSGSPGARRALWALPRIRPGVRSRPETLLRLAIVAAGMPEPVVGHHVEVARGLILHPDLTFVAERVALEYEGDGHRTDREQWMRDIERRELLEAAGYRVVRVTARDLFRGLAEFLARLRGILAERSASARAR